MGNVVASERLDDLGDLPARPRLHVESLRDLNKKTLFVTSEFSDLVKVGGLGDVSSALPRALSLYHDIRVLMPGYRQVIESGNAIKMVGKIAGLSALPDCRLGRLDLSDGLIVYVVVCPELYDREGYPYGDSEGRDWSDNYIRFALLCHVAAEIAARRAAISWYPQLVHANDWPAGLTPAYMAWRGLATPSIFTIHNLAYQGLCEPQHMPRLGVPAQAARSPSIALYDKLSFLKAGIAHATHITTVSKTYAREITHLNAGCGLHELLKAKADQGSLSGIINGIDQSWEPNTDPHLLKGFTQWEWEGKTVHARYIEEKFELDKESGPLFAVVSRLVQQKGIDLTVEVADAIVAAGGRIVVLGRGEPELETSISHLQARYPGRVSVHIGFNELDARRIFAGSDFLLMPSRFEPCGLSQMYAQRFGCLPIARRTGGLADTIDDGINGFLFNEGTAVSYLEAIMRAIHVHEHRELLNAMRRKAMASPLYWHQSVKPYDQLYRDLINEKKSRAIAPGH